jgi:peptidoglycan/xylan/chitin deacetylase (PgdA/CDA1 family)
MKKILVLFFLFSCLFAEKSVHQQIVVLCYHHVDPTLSNPYAVTPRQFAGHLDALQAAGYGFISAKQLERHLKTGQTIPEKAVLITFDDANRSVYTYAYPILKKRNIPFMVFVYPSVVMSKYRRYFTTWAQLKEMSKGGMEIGSHAFTHPILTRPPKEIRTTAAYNHWLDLELVRSREVIAEKTGLSVKYFAMPFGVIDEYGLNYLKTKGGYTLAFNVNGMNNNSYVSPDNINRWIVFNRDTAKSVLEKAALRPIEFGETYPKAYSRIDNPKPDIRFRIKNAWGINSDSIKMTVNSRKELAYRFDRNTGYYDKLLKLDLSGVYLVTITAKDNGGKPCRGTWLFIFNWQRPSFLP